MIHSKRPDRRLTSHAQGKPSLQTPAGPVPRAVALGLGKVWGKQRCHTRRHAWAGSWPRALLLHTTQAVHALPLCSPPRGSARKQHLSVLETGRLWCALTEDILAFAYHYSSSPRPELARAPSPSLPSESQTSPTAPDFGTRACRRSTPFCFTLTDLTHLRASPLLLPFYP